MGKSEILARFAVDLMFIRALAKHPLEKMTTREAAAHAGVCLATFRNWEAHGITPKRSEGYKRLYNKVEVLAFVKRLREDFKFRDYCGVYLPKDGTKKVIKLPPISGKTAGISTAQATSDQVSEPIMSSNPSESQLPVMVTTAQVAKMAGVCLRTVRYWEAKGTMPPRTTGYCRLYVWEEVKVYLQVYIAEKAYVAKPEEKLLHFVERMEAIENDMLGATIAASPQGFQPSAG